MNEGELIGLIFAGSSRYHPSIGRCTAREQLSRAELAGLLSGLKSQHMALAYAKYGADIASERQLIAHVRVWAAGLAIDEQWRIVKGRPTVSNMAAVAVLEFVRPNPCKECGGLGETETGRVCPRCNGSGRLALPGDTVAEAIGVDKSNYSRTWRRRYEKIFQYVQVIDSEINMTIRRNKRRVDLLDLALA